ncbi:hypothetical protein [Micromonospora sp. NPDC005367]|uniref:hypothetical protein n=1 Tax=Micromonospora sp. NPDC005367 TaxID=3155590 RepID=UPI00339EFA22
MSRIVQLLASPVHRYVARPSDEPAPATSGELAEGGPDPAGLGIVGDRYFGKQAHRDASVIAQESLPLGVDLVRRQNSLPSGPGPGWRSSRTSRGRPSTIFGGSSGPRPSSASLKPPLAGARVRRR